MNNTVSKRLRFLKHLCIYVGGAVGVQSATMLAFPLWITYFSPAEYGIVTLLHTFQHLLGMVAGLNLAQVFTLHFCHTPDTEKTLFIQNMYLVSVASFMLCSLGLFSLLPLITQYLFAGAIPSSYLFASMLISGLTFIKTITLLYVQHTERPALFTALHSVESITYLISILYGVVIIGGKSGAMLAAQLCSLALTLLIAAFMLRPTIIWTQTHLKNLVHLAREGATLYPFLVSSYLFSLGDRLVINHYAGLHTVGLYSFASKFAQLFQTLIITPLRRTYVPYIQKQYNASMKEGYAENKWYTHIYFLIMSLGLVCAFFIAKPLMVRYVPHTFHEGLPYLFFLAPATILFGALIFSNSLLWYTKQKKGISVTLAATGITNILLNRFAVTRWGGIGCAFSTLICSIIYFCASSLQAQRTLHRLTTQHQSNEETFKILHCIDSLQSGGIPTVLRTLLTSLQHTSPETKHVVAYIRTGPVVADIEKRGIRTVHLRQCLPRYDFSLIPRLMYLIYTERPAGVHLTMTNSLFFGRIACWLMRTPCIGAIHGNMNYMGRLSHYGMKLMGGMAARYITVSKETQQIVRKKLPRSFDTRDVTLIPNGLDIANLQKQQLNPLTRSMVGLTNDAFVIGSVGRFSPEKSFTVLIRSFAHLQKRISLLSTPKKAQLCLVGYGPELPTLMKLSKSLGVNDDVFFVGQQANPFPYYALFDAFALSSQTEGDPLVILEAMASGVPVVITHHETSHPTIRQGETGFFVPLNDSRGLAEKLFSLATNEAIRGTIGAAGKTFVEQRNSADIMAEQYFAVFKSAAQQHENKD